MAVRKIPLALERATDLDRNRLCPPALCRNCRTEPVGFPSCLDELVGRIAHDTDAATSDYTFAAVGWNDLAAVETGLDPTSRIPTVHGCCVVHTDPVCSCRKKAEIVRIEYVVPKGAVHGIDDSHTPGCLGSIPCLVVWRDLGRSTSCQRVGGSTCSSCHPVGLGVGPVECTAPGWRGFGRDG